jgi:hypothetical protein
MKPHTALAAPLLAAALSLGAAAPALATDTWMLTEYTVSYDDSTPFGNLAFAFGSGSTVGFTWFFPTSVQAVSTGPATTAAFSLPDFTVTANPGWLLSGPFTGFLGNVVYTEVGAGASTSMAAASSVQIDAMPAMPLLVNIDKTGTASGPGFESGYFAESIAVPLAGFSSVSFSGGTLTLVAAGGTFASIIAQPQNELTFSFTATPVPEPQTYALLLAGLAAVGWVVTRRGRG